MRRTLILALLALLLSAALCALGTASVSRAVDAAEGYLHRAECDARAGELDSAAEAIRALELDWRRRWPMLELLTVHDALADVEGAAADARICLENGSPGEFYRAAAGLTAQLKRVRDTEAVRLANLF